MSRYRQQTKIIWFLLPFLVILAFFILRQSPLLTPSETLETGQGFTASRQGKNIEYNFTEGYRQIDLALTELLATGGLAPSEYSRLEREARYSQPLSPAVSRSWFSPQQSKVIRWPYKELTILTPPTDGGLLVFDYQWMLEDKLARIGAEVITEELVEVDPTERQWDKLSETVGQMESERVIGLRLTLGYNVNLAGQQATVITHDVTFVQPWSAEYVQRFPGQVKPKISIVLDDWGYDYPEVVHTMLSLPVKLNMAVIPGLPKSTEHAVLGFTRGWEVMLHLPMEPQGPGWRLGEYGVLTTMSDAQIRETVRKNIEALPAISGVNNHMGSAATADPRVVRIVLDEVAKNELFFVDSHTTGASVVPEVAATLNIPIAENRVFLDNQDDVDYILQRLEILVELARREGQALGIGHLRPNTARALERFFRSQSDWDFQVVPASSLVSS